MEYRQGYKGCQLGMLRKVVFDDYEQVGQQGY